MSDRISSGLSIVCWRLMHAASQGESGKSLTSYLKMGRPQTEAKHVWLSNQVLTYLLYSFLMRHGVMPCRTQPALEGLKKWATKRCAPAFCIHSNSALLAALVWLFPTFLLFLLPRSQVDLHYPHSLPITNLCEFRDCPLIFTCTFPLSPPTWRLPSPIPSPVLLAKQSWPPFKSLYIPSEWKQPTRTRA